MLVENKNFTQFKSYSYYSKQKEVKKPTLKPIAILGAGLGVLGANVATNAIFGKKNPSEKEMVKVARMLSMAFLGNVGAILTGSIGATKEQKINKIKEGAFQIMNTSIPMLMVTGAITACNKIKTLNNKPAKIIGSAIGMVGGAWLATQITNLTKKDGEAKRKYTIKDSVANIDDIAATLVIGFPQLEKINIVAQNALPFIYTYCGSRAGSKE